MNLNFTKQGASKVNIKPSEIYFMELASLAPMCISALASDSAVASQWGPPSLLDIWFLCSATYLILHPAELRVILRSQWLKMAVNSLHGLHFKSPLSLSYWWFLVISWELNHTINMHLNGVFCSTKVTASKAQCAVFESVTLWKLRTGKKTHFGLNKPYGSMLPCKVFKGGVVIKQVETSWFCLFSVQK